MSQSNRSKSSQYLTTVAVVLAVAVAAAIAVFSPTGPRALAEETQELTAPTPVGMEQATFAAGCFWSMQAIFQQLKGVDVVSPGYAGGTALHPSYDDVETGATGYAETINITFDPKVITYRQLLHVLLTVRDPTTVDAQGPDVGNNYRSVIFYRDVEQKNEAEQEIREINGAHIWQNAIVTQVVPFSTFWRAEAYHLNYYNLHPNEDYCAYVIAPEIAKFRSEYKPLLKS